ncbi:MAG: heme-binding domain-containing protein [Flavobacteriales bacterium]|nr:heme-binding domain-containing protein [Flavobacteriales bacterium]
MAQLFQPDRSAPTADPALDMLAMTNAPPDIRDLVTGACYDCHSYTTDHPWYAYVAPLSFIVQDHINEGREHLNFSLWDTYATDKHAGEAGKVLQDGEMPPGYYRLMHGHGRMSDADKQKLVAWFNTNLGSEGGGGMGTEAEEGDEH